MKYRINKDVLWKFIDGETVIVKPDSDKYSYLNSTGTIIWKMIDEGSPVGKIVDYFVHYYDHPAENLQADIEEIIEKLVGEGFVEKDEQDG